MATFNRVVIYALQKCDINHIYTILKFYFLSNCHRLFALMFYDKNILAFIAALLFCSMTITDAGFLFQEEDEAERRTELELEESENHPEGYDWFKFLLSGSDGLAIAQISYQFQQKIAFYTLEIVQRNCTLCLFEIPLFLKFCSLKIPSC